MSQNERNIRQRTQTNNAGQYLSSILDNYTRHFNELLNNGGVYNGNVLETTADQLKQYSYFQLANMTPDEISNLINTAPSPAVLYFAINPNSSNFRDHQNFNYTQIMRMLLLHTNENGILTDNVTEHGQLLYGALIDLQREIALNNRTTIRERSQENNERIARNQSNNSSNQITPGSLIDITLHDYNTMLNVLRQHNGIRATNIDDELELVLPFNQIITYSQLAHMTPQQIRQLYNENTRPEDIIQMITPQDDNFDELEENNIAFSDDFYSNLSRLLEFTNQQGELTNASTEWGQRLAAAYSDLLEVAVNDVEDDFDDDTDLDENDNDNDDQQVAPSLTRQDNRRTNVTEDAWEIHNYTKNINKEDLIEFLTKFKDNHPEVLQFYNNGLQHTNGMQDFLDYLNQILLQFVNQYVDTQDKERYTEYLHQIMTTCLQYTNFTRIRYHNISLAQFIVLVLTFVQAQPPNFIDSYVRGYINETVGAYKTGREMSCPKGGMERLWTVLGDLSKTFEGQPVYIQNHYLDLYSIINNIFRLDYEQLLNIFTDEWYRQLKTSQNPPSSNNRQINMNYYKNYVLMRFNNHLKELYPNPTAEEETELNNHKTQFAALVNLRLENPPPELDEIFDYVYKITNIGGKRHKKQTNKRKYKQTNKKKQTNKRKKGKKTKKRTYHNNKKTKKYLQKGGLLNTIGVNIGGIDFSKETGKKQYNWKTGKWDPMDCYKIGPIPFCKVRKS